MEAIKPTIGISYAVQGAAAVECTNRLLNFWRIRWDFEQVVDEEHPEAKLVSFKECQFDHKPSIEEVKYVIIASYNQDIDREIISGFSWNGIPVWLSSENQFNYKAAYDLAVQTDGATLPVRFKFGTDDDPVYYQFYTVDELRMFYMAVIDFVTWTLNEGWRQKDAFDWSQYQTLLAKDNV